MLVALGLIAAFLLVAIYSRPSMRGCRWREDRRPGTPAFRCAACGAVSDARPGRCLKRG